MDSERILALMAKQIGQAASAQDLAELKQLLVQHPEYAYLFEILSSLREPKQHQEPARAEEDLIRESWPMLERELEEAVSSPGAADVRTGSRIRIMRFLHERRMHRAAIWIGIILVGGGMLFFWGRPDKASPLSGTTGFRQLKVPYGVPRKKQLPDSSVVWLNAGSRIRFAERFVQKDREVYLEGEAYFQVHRDEAHPFIVHAGNMVIRVLGTDFNVKAYQDENRVEATLISGKVQVCIWGKPDKKIILTPHEKLTIINQKYSISGEKAIQRKEVSFQVKEVVPLRTADPIPEVAWVKDKLVFQNERFGDLAKKLERRFDVHIVFSDTVLMHERLSGVFENESILKALNLLQMTTPFRYRTTGDSVFLSQ